MRGAQASRRVAAVFRHLLRAVVAGILLAGFAVPALAQRPPPNMPFIVPPPPPPPNISPAVAPKIGGTQPDFSNVVSHTRDSIQPTGTNQFNDNFLTESWGKGHNGNGLGGAGQGVGSTASNNAAKGPNSAPREVLVVVDGIPTDAEVDALAARHRLARIESQSFPFIAATVFRWRIPDARSTDDVLNDLNHDSAVRLAQRNLYHHLQEDAGVRPPLQGDPAEYAIRKLHLSEAHLLTRGGSVVVAVIDTGIDVTHPELAGSIIGTYDALNIKEGPQPHGTGVAGTIVAHMRLIGSAPDAKLLAIRAFAASPTNGAESTTFVVMKSLSYAVEHKAQVINMSFAGPADPLVQQGLGAASARGIVLVAAAGNAGPNSPPLYPAADSHVIAVTATDSGDRLFPAANRGPQIAVAAPGVDILMPSPDDKYQVKSGTSFAAGYVSGLVALLIDRNPAIAPDAVRAALVQTAHDLGPTGRDDQFGAGLADALSAVNAVSRSMTAGAGKTEAAPASASH